MTELTDEGSTSKLGPYSTYFEILKLFRAADTLDEDGKISGAEMERLLQCLGFNPTKDQVKDFMREIDKDGDDTRVTEDEFISFIRGEKEPSEELRKAFKYFDLDGSGFIDKWELRAILLQCDDITEQQVDVFFEEMDSDNDNRIDITEFINTMQCPKQGHARATEQQN